MKSTAARCVRTTLVFARRHRPVGMFYVRFTIIIMYVVYYGVRKYIYNIYIYFFYYNYYYSLPPRNKLDHCVRVWTKPRPLHIMFPSPRLFHGNNRSRPSDVWTAGFQRIRHFDTTDKSHAFCTAVRRVGPSSEYYILLRSSCDLCTGTRDSGEAPECLAPVKCFGPLAPRRSRCRKYAV